jgi:hypothetical protein
MTIERAEGILAAANKTLCDRQIELGWEVLKMYYDRYKEIAES